MAVKEITFVGVAIDVGKRTVKHPMAGASKPVDETMEVTVLTITDREERARYHLQMTDENRDELVRMLNGGIVVPKPSLAVLQ